DLERLGGTELYRFMGTNNAHALFEKLALAGIYVRRFDWSETHLRIGLPATSEAELRLSRALNPLG
ncbi:MAG: threonine-phosphate decarboxylase, partial [Pseudomonadota bacterium]